MSNITICQPSVELIEAATSDLAVLQAMLVSTNQDMPEDPTTPQNVGRINYLMKGRHGSPFEHNMFKFRVKAPIVVFREWHRHRIGFSYNEMSGRYTELPAEFYIPPPERPLIQHGKPGAYTMMPGPRELYNDLVDELTEQFEAAYDSYTRMTQKGIAKEVARGVLPVYIMSQMYVTCNARSLMAFLSLRTHEPDALFVSTPMWEIDVPCARVCEAALAEFMPVTYEAFNKNRRVSP